MLSMNISLENEVKSVSDATVRCKPTEDYDGFCAALKAKKKIYGRHNTSLTILTLMAKDIPGIPKPADAVAKLVGLMKRAVVMVDEENKGDESALSTGLFHCLEVEACCDEGDENDSIKVDDIRTRTSTREVPDVAIEILLELVSQLSVTWRWHIDCRSAAVIIMVMITQSDGSGQRLFRKRQWDHLVVVVLFRMYSAGFFVRFHLILYWYCPLLKSLRVRSN